MLPPQADPDDVLRKGSGTLCEFLLQVEGIDRLPHPPKPKPQGHDSMHTDDVSLLDNGRHVCVVLVLTQVEAFERRIICPNKQKADYNKTCDREQSKEERRLRSA